MTVEVLAGSVITHGGAWVGVPGSDLDIPQVDARVQHGGDKCMAQHVRMRTGDLHTCAPTAGGSGIRTIFVPFPHTRSTRCPCSSPRSAMSAPVASKIRKPSSPSMATSANRTGPLTGGPR